MQSRLSQSFDPSGTQRDIAGGTEVGSPLSLLDLLCIAAAHRWILIWCTAACTLTAILVALLLPAHYTARATLLPSQPSSSSSLTLPDRSDSTSGLVLLATGTSKLKQSKEEELTLLRSRSVEDALILRYGLMEVYRAHNLTEARNDLERFSDVDVDSIDGMIHIDVHDRDPHRAAELANGFVDQFQYLTDHIALNKAAQRRVFFEEELRNARAELASAEEELKQTEEKTGVIDLDRQTRTLIASGAVLSAQIGAKEVEIRGMETYATGDNAQFVQARQELRSLEQQLAKFSKGERTPSDSDLLIAKNETPRVELDYSRKLRNLAFHEMIYEILAHQFEVAKLDAARERSLIQIVDVATIPESPSSPDRLSLVTGAAICGFLGGLYIVFASAVLEYLGSRPVTRRKLHYFSSLFAGRRRFWLQRGAK